MLTTYLVLSIIYIGLSIFFGYRKSKNNMDFTDFMILLSVSALFLLGSFSLIQHLSK